MSAQHPKTLASVVGAPTVFRAAGLVAGLLVAATCLATDTLGRGLIMAVPSMCVATLVGVLCAELAIRRQSFGTRRQAALEVRRIVDYLPRPLSAAVGAAAAALAVLLVVTTAMGSADDAGRPGRVLLGAGPGGSSPLRARSLADLLVPHETSAYSPWVGSYYSLPLGLVLLAGLLWTWVALHRIARRPRLADPSVAAGPTSGTGPNVLADSTQADDRRRRGSAHLALGAFGILASATLVIIAALSAVGLLSVTGHPGTWTVGAGVLILLVPAALGVLAASIAAALGSTGLASVLRLLGTSAGRLR